TRRFDNAEARKRRLIHELEALGHKVTIEPPPRSRSPTSITDQPDTQPGHRPLPPKRAWSPQLRLNRLALNTTRSPAEVFAVPAASPRRSSPRSSCKLAGEGALRLDDTVAALLPGLVPGARRSPSATCSPTPAAWPTTLPTRRP
ncbi:MAG: hypothetical protein M3313_05120, partial [Actinomycetota bacterium]|nr:hypothetical protein [Actinomycetota bacterium]